MTSRTIFTSALFTVSAVTGLVFLAIQLLDVDYIGTVTGTSKTHNSIGSYWSTGKNMPTPRGEFAAVLLDGKIYAIGGVDYRPGFGRMNIVEIYDIASNRWSVGKPLPIPLDHFACAVYDGKIYVVGGYVAQKVPTDKVFIYDTDRNEWQEGKSLPSPRGALKAQFIDDKLYAVGGLNSSEAPVNTNYVYDPKTATWTEKKPMLTARQHFASAVLDGKLFVMGGRILGDGVPSEDISITLTNFNRVEVYDPKLDSWTALHPMLTKRTGFAAASSGGNIYVFGGQDVVGISKTVEKYDPVLDRWTFDKPMSTARFAFTAVAFDDKIYVVGGQRIVNSDIEPLQMNEIFHTGDGE